GAGVRCADNLGPAILGDPDGSMLLRPPVSTHCPYTTLFRSLLNIIASSMLAVTTFSLGVMTAAFSAATTNVTPRATRLLMEDDLTNNVLSTFIGAFLFSIVGIIVLKTG